jgi:uncharacterized protein
LAASASSVLVSPSGGGIKYRRLLDIISSLGSALVAFSGGVDSSFLCHAAAAALGKKALAATIVSPMLPRRERRFAADMARLIGIEHLLIDEPEIDETVAANPGNRCYFCKRIEFGALLRAAADRGIAAVLDGSNADDPADYRPGLRALEELGIKSPLREAGLTKDEIRALSKQFRLPSWDKSSFACLASRIPYGERISTEKLSRIEKAEEALWKAGFRQFRVRSHGDMARIEVSPGERRRFFNESLLDDLSKKIKSAGFVYAAFELEGYVMGSMNRVLKENHENPAL